MHYRDNYTTKHNEVGWMPSGQNHVAYQSYLHELLYFLYFLQFLSVLWGYLHRRPLWRLVTMVLGITKPSVKSQDPTLIEKNDRLDDPRISPFELITR